MTDDTDATPNRRTVLRGAAVVGLPLMADAGSARTGPASAQADHELVVRAAEGETVTYTFRVSGSVERGETADDRDAVLGGTAVKGEVFDGREDSFRFTGELVTLRLDGAGTVHVDGELVRDTTTDDALPNTITLEAEDERVAYEFRVSGQVAKTEDAGTLGVDTIEGNVVSGKVGGSIQGNPDPVDSYRYSGAIEVEETDGPLTVTLDIGGAETEQ
ncbi:hypothetical protein [Halorussus lipolyticus]|uniref:hypothetical protein n=1 Tax=Halorussus lipolyticus TaxID=3034024 RepID=UPI0023E868B3|nr:hypothetical protein [Halorussus sp. DT80]